MTATTSLSRTRRDMIQRIKALMAPHMRDSGYRAPIDPSKGIFGGTKPLRLWLIPPKKGERVPARMRGFVLTEMIGIAEGGPITDAFGGGCVVVGYDQLPIEDISMLERWIARAALAQTERPDV